MKGAERLDFSLTKLARDDLHERPQGVPPPHLPVVGADDSDDGLELIGGSHDRFGMLAAPEGEKGDGG